MYGRSQSAGAAHGRMGAMQAWSHGIPAELTVFVQKTYALLSFSLVLAAAACWAMIQVMPTATVTLKGGGTAVISTFPRWGLWLLWGGMMVFGFLGNHAKNGARQGETSVAGLLFLCAMVVCAGAMLGPTLGTFVGLGMANVVLAAAGTTAVVFIALTAYVLISGKNFSFMAGIVGMAFLAFFVAWMANAIFFQSANFQWWMAAIGAILVSAMILVNTSSVIRFFGPNNLVVPAVIALFVDIFNLFIMMLTLFAGRRNE